MGRLSEVVESGGVVIEGNDLLRSSWVFCGGGGEGGVEEGVGGGAAVEIGFDKKSSRS